MAGLVLWRDVSARQNPFVPPTTFSDYGVVTGSWGFQNAFTVSAGQTITATFTWHATNGDQPVYPVYVLEHCTATINGGSAADGFGDAPSTNAGITTSSGYRLDPVQSGGNSFSIPGDSPTVQTNGIESGAAITYTASVIAPGVVSLNGVTNPPSNDILIGQELDASVSVPNPQTGDRYIWNITGPVNPFGSFAVATDASSGHSVSWTPDASSSSTTVYFKTQGSFIITCLYEPVGGGQPLTFKNTGDTWVPTSINFQGYVVGTGTFIPSASSNPVLVQFSGASGPGIIFSGAATTPAEFVSGGDSGTWAYIQLWTPQRKEGNLVPKDSTYGLVKGVQGLDTNFPYDSPNEPYDDSHLYEAPANGTVINQGGNLDNPTKPPGAIWQDTPAQSSDSGNQTSVTANDAFVGYMLYFPPSSNAGGSQYVPLKTINWGWDAGANWGGSTWTFSTNTHSYSAGSTYPGFPSWTVRVYVPKWSWVSP